MFERSGPAGREGLASVLHNRGWVADLLGDRPAALDWYRQAVAAKTALLGADHPSTINTRTALAGTLAALDRLQEAEAELMALLPDTARRMGERSSFYYRLWNEIGSVRQSLGHYDAAAEGYRRSIEIALDAENGVMSTSIAQTINNLANLDEERGDLAAAERGYRESLAVRLKTQDANSLLVARARHNLARVLQRRGRIDEASGLARAARAARDAALPPQAFERLASQGLIAEILLDQGDRDGAMRETQALLAALPSAQATVSQRAGLHRVLARLHARTGDAAEARRHAEATLAIHRDLLGDAHPLVAIARLDLADAIAATDPAAADTLRRSAKEVLDPLLAPTSPDRARWATRTR
jgi:serine/threonine-protein kinase